MGRTKAVAWLGFISHMSELAMAVEKSFGRKVKCYLLLMNYCFKIKIYSPFKFSPSYYFHFLNYFQFAV